jgi:hypothetical protein
VSAESSTDNLIAYVDQALFLGLRATGQAAAMQMVWVYDDPVDWDELRRFHQDFGFGLAGRMIEPSVLPFGRHRWVSSTGPAAPLDIVAEPRPRSELSDWLDERAQLPSDPETGPAWHMGVLPMTDGSTAVSLVGSHCIGAGGAALRSVFEAVQGVRRELGYPLPRSRTWRQALIADTRQTWRDAPELGRTLVAAARFLRNKRRESSGTSTPRTERQVIANPDETVVVPVISAFVGRAGRRPRRKRPFAPGRARGAACRASGPSAGRGRHGWTDRPDQRSHVGGHQGQRGHPGLRAR